MRYSFLALLFWVPLSLVQVKAQVSDHLFLEVRHGLRSNIHRQLGASADVIAGYRFHPSFGLGISGLTNAPGAIVNIRGLIGGGVHYLYLHGRLLGWAEVGYTLKAVDGQSDYFYDQFYPGHSAGNAPYGRLGVGFRVWKGLMLQASWLQTLPVEGDRYYSVYDSNGNIRGYQERIRHSMGSLSMGIGLMIGGKESLN